MKTTLLQILWKKEKIHWKRIKQIFGKFNGWFNKLFFGLIVVIFVTIFHWLFAIMHTLYEIFLFIFIHDAFKSNLQKLTLNL